MNCSRNSGARQVFCAGLLTVLLLGVPGPARAQESFDQRMRRAMNLFDSAKLEEACDEFKFLNSEKPSDKQTQMYLKISCDQVKALQKREEDLFNQGVELFNKGQLDDARQKFEECGRVGGLRNYRFHDKALDYIRKIDDALGKQRAARAPKMTASKMGTLIVSSSPTAAKITIDGHSKPDWVTPHTFQEYAAGRYLVVVSKSGYDDYVLHVTVEDGKTASLNAKLSVPTGEINIQTMPPGLEVFIDGRSYGPSPVRAAVAEGQHTYEIRRPGMPAYVKSFTARSGEILVKKVDFGGGATASGTPPASQATRGHITAVDGTTVLADLLSAKGIRVGTILALYKSGYPNTPVGAVEVTQVRDSGFKARILTINSGLKPELGDSVAVEAQNAVLTGYVYDEEGRPLAGAVVRLINSNIGFWQAQTTDADGSFTFPSVPPGSGYLTSVEMKGFDPVTYTELEFNAAEYRVLAPPFILQPLAQAPRSKP